jgi:hypothetical protein
VKLDPKCFRSNLQALAQILGQNLRQLSNHCQFDEAGYKWLRKAASKGVGRRQKNNEERLDALRKLVVQRFDLPQNKATVEILWLPDMVKRLSKFNSELLSQNDIKRSVEELIELLKTGRYGFLRELVNHLHAQFERDELGKSEMLQKETSNLRDRLAE